MLQSTQSGFCITGTVNVDSVVALRIAGEKYIAEHAARPIMIDLSQMTELDASCFSLFLCWVRCAIQKKCTLTFSNASQSIQRMSQLFCLREIFHG